MAVTDRDRVRGWWLIAAASVMVILLAGVVALQFYVRAFNRSPWQTVPSQVAACGRDYIFPDESHPQALAAASRSAGAVLDKVASTPGWFRSRAIWAHRYRGSE